MMMFMLSIAPSKKCCTKKSLSPILEFTSHTLLCTQHKGIRDHMTSLYSMTYRIKNKYDNAPERALHLKGEEEVIIVIMIRSSSDNAIATSPPSSVGRASDF